MARFDDYATKYQTVRMERRGKRAHRERARLTREGIEIDRRIQNALIGLAESSHRER